MKNKVLTYILIAAVIAIWGYVIYRIIQATGTDDSELIVRKQMVSKPQDLNYYTLKKLDTLNLDFRDPIYSKDKITLMPEVINSNNTSTNVPYENYYAPPPPEPETYVAYLGFVENEKEKKKTAIIQVENNQYMLGIRESAQGVTVLEIKDDYIRIKEKNKSKTLFK